MYFFRIYRDLLLLIVSLKKIIFTYDIIIYVIIPKNEHIIHIEIKTNHPDIELLAPGESAAPINHNRFAVWLCGYKINAVITEITADIKIFILQKVIIIYDLIS